MCAVCVLVAALAALATRATPARADVVDLGPCGTASLTQPFLPWLDASWYELAPGGDFETSSWTLTGQAQIVPGSEPFAATGALGSWSLSLPGGSTATSPTTCVDAAYPTLRFFIAGQGTVAAGLVDDGIYLPLGVVTATGNWAPTPVMLTDSALLAALSGGTAQVSVELTALSGDPQIDDVFIDPWNRG